MFYQVLAFLWSILLDLMIVSRMAGSDKDLEIVLLRQQLAIVERRQKRGPQIPRWQKVPLGSAGDALERDCAGQSGADGGQLAALQAGYGDGLASSSGAA